MRTSWDALRSLARYVNLVMGPEWEVRLADEEGVFKRPLAMVFTAGPAPRTVRRLFTEVAEPFTIHLYPPARAKAEEALQTAMAAEERLTAALADGVALQALPAPKPTAELTLGALAAGTYDYSVAALNRWGSTPPGAVTRATLVAPGGVRLTWPTSTATRYRVYRDGRFLVQVEAPPYVDTGQRVPTVAVPPVENKARLAHVARVPLYDYDGLTLTEAAGEDRRGASDYLRVLDGPNVTRVRDPSDPTFYTIICAVRCGWTRRPPVPSAPTVTGVDLSV